MYCFECNEDSSDDGYSCSICGKPVGQDPDRYFKAGMESLASGDSDLCIRLLYDCLALNPDHLSARFNLGTALSLADRYNEAIEHFTAVAEIDPTYPGIYTALGQAAFGSYLAHAEEAESKRRIMIQLLTKAIEQDPEDVDAYFSLGNAYLAIGTGDKALPWLKRALNLHPDSPAVYFTLAKAFKMLHRYPEATIMAKKSVQLSGPDDPFWEDIRGLLNELEQAVLPL